MSLSIMRDLIKSKAKAGQSNFSPAKFVSVTAILVLTSLLSTSLAAAPKAPVKVEQVKRAELTTTLNVHGTIYGKSDVNLTAGANGKLIYVAEPGQVVQQGDVVAQIDMLPLQLEQAEQQLLIERAQISLQYQQTELSRLKVLATTDAAAAYQLDLTQNQHDLARSDIDLAKLKLQQINDRITRATVKAPFDGIVSQRFRPAGSDVNRADQLVRLLDINRLEVQLFVPVKYLSQMQVGMQVSVNRAANLDSRYENSIVSDSNNKNTATVIAVIPSADKQSQTIEVRASLNYGLQNKLPKKQWAAGQLVDVEVPIVDNQSSLLVNRDALIIRREGVHVVKIDSENKAKRVPVIVGKGQGQLVEIRNQSQEPELLLSEGDVIAVRGAERLVDAQEVEVQTTPS